MLHDFIERHRERIITRARSLVGTRPRQAAGEDELDTGIPLFLTQLGQALRVEAGQDLPPDGIGASAAQHGGDLSAKGFTFAQVVDDYGDVCQSITGLAVETGEPITTGEFHTLNRCLDTAIAASVTEFARRRELASSDREAERMGHLAHELLNRLHSAMLAFQVLESGKVGVSGVTGAVLKRSLLGLGELIEGAVVEGRLAEAKPAMERVSLKGFIEELTGSARLLAGFRDVAFSAEPVDPALEVVVNVPLLSSALNNLLQNAFKYTRPRSSVVLRTRAGSGRIHLEVEDECGGLAVDPGPDLELLKEPRGDGKSGLGLGLSICRKATERNGGEVRARNLPGHGCVFELDLPEAPPASA
jgi:signal transduction histidine kinase